MTLYSEWSLPSQSIAARSIRTYWKFWICFSRLSSLYCKKEHEGKCRCCKVVAEMSCWRYKNFSYTCLLNIKSFESYWCQHTVHRMLILLLPFLVMIKCSFLTKTCDKLLHYFVIEALVFQLHLTHHLILKQEN